MSQNYSRAGARRTDVQKEKTMPMFTLVTNDGADAASTYDEGQPDSYPWLNF